MPRIDTLRRGELLRSKQGGDYVFVGKTADGKLIVRPLILGKPVQADPSLFTE
jgi:hypothetical protein